MTTEKTTVVTEAASAALIEVQGREVSIGTALHIGQRFATSARRGSEESDITRRLTWLTGNNDAWSLNGKQALPSARGWFIDQPDEDQGLLPDDYKLMDAMEVLCEQGKAAACLVAHDNDNGGKPRKVPSWSLPVASLFVICEGVPSKREMLADASCRWGVAYAWPQGKGSEVHLLCYVKELMDAGYSSVFTVKFSGVITDKALGCLHAQNYVLNFADGLRERAGDDIPVAYYSYALPIRCSLSTITAGRAPKKTTEVYYPVPAIPRLSLRHIDDATAYLESVAITAGQAVLIEDGDRVAQTVTWSVEKSKRLIAGDVSGDDDNGGSYVGVDMDGNPITMKTPF